MQDTLGITSQDLSRQSLILNHCVYHRDLSCYVFKMMKDQHSANWCFTELLRK